MSFDKKEIIKYLNDNLKKSRLNHTLYTVKAAKYLAQKYDMDVEKIEIAALLHDCGKNLDDKKLLEFSRLYGYKIDEICLNQPNLLHGAAGAYIARERFGINDKEILDAITYHNIPRIDMTKFDMIIRVADLIEESRDIPGINEIRMAADIDIELALMVGLRNVMIHTLKKNVILHPNSLYVFNKLLKRLKKNGKLYLLDEQKT